MIIEVKNIEFEVEYGCDDGVLYVESALVNGVEFINVLNQDAIDELETKLEKRLIEENEESKWESRIDDLDSCF